MDKWLQNNNVVKVIALLAGILLWIVVHMDVQSSSTGSGSLVREDKVNNVAITPKYDSDQYYIKSIEPAEATVVLRWKESSLRRVNTGNLQVELDLSRYTEGQHVIPLRATGVSDWVTAEVIPQTVKVVIEKKEKKVVPVVINVTGTPADGYKAGQPVIKPNRVQVTVPESRLEEVDAAKADISVDKATGNISKQVKLTVYDKAGKPIEGIVNPQLVEVEVPVTSPFKQMPLQVKVTGQPAAGFSVESITQVPDQVTVYAPEDVLNKLEFYEGLQIDLTGLKESKKMTMDIPLMNKATQVTPNKVEVSISVVPSTVKVVDNVPITLVGDNPGFTAKLVTPDTGKVSIQLEGAPAILDKLKPQDVQAVADVSNLSPGRHELNITWNLPMFVKKPATDYKAVVEVTGGGNPAPSPTAKPSPSPVTPTPSPSPSSAPAQSKPTETPTPTPVPSSTATPTPGASTSPAASTVP